MIQLFGSISSYPGSTGTYYYSRFFKYYGINAEYNSFKANNLNEVQNYLANNSYSGFNVSMPFKLQVTKYLDFSSSEVDYYNSCNTIKIQKNELHGFNTDIDGVLKIVSGISQSDYVLVLGNGAMGKMFAKALQFKNIEFKVISPSLNNWDTRHQKCDVLINCTSLGTSIPDSPIDLLNGIHTVHDLAFNGSNLRKICDSINYFSGIFLYKEVFLKQFLIHTNISPDLEYFDFLTKVR
jgi:shikimate dehydrogenase